MSITNYGELKTAIANYLHRNDLTTRVPEFISYAESLISNDPSAQLPGVRCRSQITRSTMTVDSQYENTPTDILEIVDLQLNSDPISPLGYLSPKQMTQKYPGSTSGKPLFYTIHGGEFQFAPIPDSSYTLEYTYYARFSAFSGDSDTNWLLTNHPMIYVYAACIAGSSFVEGNADKFIQMYQLLVNGINATETRAVQGAQLKARPYSATP